MNKVIIILLVVLLIAGFGWYFLNKEEAVKLMEEFMEKKPEARNKIIDFSKINSEFLFSSEIPQEFKSEYLSNLKAINIYNPNLQGDNNLEKSVLYITYFKSDRFLTLSTVNITRQEPTKIGNREAVLYEITKKNETPNFSGQPDWRNRKHIAIDIKYSQENPTYFYSFALNPKFLEKEYLKIIDSLIFK